MTSTTAIRPFNQRIRIWTLRGCGLLAIPLILFTESMWMRIPLAHELLEVTGTFLIIFAVLGRFWAILYIGAMKNRTVMQDGPYSICRHPLYLFSTMGVVGFGLMLGSLVLVAVLGGAVFAILSATAAREEAFLRHEFGAAYDNYTARVPRLLPAPWLFRTEPDVSVSVKALRINFADALVFLALFPIADLLELVREYGLVPTILLF